jgi:hypothetical protein
VVQRFLVFSFQFSVAAAEAAVVQRFSVFSFQFSVVAAETAINKE